MKKLYFFALILILALSLTACVSVPTTTGPAIQLESVWVRASAAAVNSGMDSSDAMPGSGPVTAGYLVIANRGDEADRLIGVKTDAATTAEIHISEMKGDVMSMRPLDFINIPPNSKVELKPGSFHIMLIGLTRELAAGDTVLLTLQFETVGEISVEAEVKMP